jgi:hypothetical protein
LNVVVRRLAGAKTNLILLNIAPMPRWHDAAVADKTTFNFVQPQLTNLFQPTQGMVPRR